MSLIESRVGGEGVDIVLLHGTPQAPSDLDTLADALATRARVHRLASPGYGSEPLPLPFSWDSTFEAVEDYVQTHCDNPWLVGVSGGGYRALALASRGKVGLRGVVGVAALAHLEPAQSEGLRQAAGALEAGVELTNVLVGQWFSSAFAKANRERCTEIVRSYLSALPMPSLIAEVRATADCPDLRPALASVNLPIHLIVGELDVATPPALSEAILAAAPRVEMSVVSGAGHLLHHERFADLVGRLERATGG